MKLFRHIATTALITVGLFSAVTYTSCSKSEDAANAKFVGTYSATETCTPPLSGTGWTSQITASSAGSNMIVIDNFGDSGASVTATVTSSGGVTIPTVVVSGATVAGSGSLSGNTLTIVYSISGGSYTGNCTQTLIKQ